MRKNLKQEKKDFRKKSLAMSQIIKRVGTNFAKEIFKHVKPTIRYRIKRYLLEDIARYLNKTNEGRDIFIELVGGQSCFLPPLGKNKQGKLFIRNSV
jgi:hypothetical protein